MEKEKISVIIPVYKVEKYLDRCVESVVNQTYKNLEIILVDDGSPDNCPKMCDDWAKKDSRIKVIHKQNGGLSDARNFGIEASTGQYLTFVDSDDYLDLDFYEKLLGQINKNDADLAIGGVEFVYEKETANDANNDKVDIINGVFFGDDVNKLIYNKRIPCLVTATTKLYKKYLFKDVRFPIGRLHEDEFVYYQILFNANKVVFCQDAKYYYLQRATSIMYNRSEKNGRDTLDAFKNKFKFIENKLPQNHEQNLELYAMELMGIYFKFKNYKNLKEEILNKYKKVYRDLERKGFKNWLFKNFRFIYTILYKIKNHG